MYITEDNKNLMGVVVPSQYAAQKELGNWLGENNYRTIRDLHEMAWNFKIELSETPEPTMKKMVQKLSLASVGTTDAAALVSAGVLSTDHDARLVSLIGDRNIPMFINWGSQLVDSVQDAKMEIQDKLPKIREFLRSPKIEVIKLQLVHRFVDRTAEFGGQI